MAAISQIVDERIEQIRKERAELDELRVSLERKESELFKREQEQNEDVGATGDRKDVLLKEIEELTAQAERLRKERDSQIENFGGEINKVHAEKAAESSAQVKQLQSEIAFLIKGKTELEADVEALQTKINDLTEKAEHDQARIIDEKEAILTRTRAEREASLKEITLSHSVAIAELDREKKDLENEISVLEQNKTIEWNKVQAEISRHKTAQLSELDAQREQFLAEMEKEKAGVSTSLRSQERKQLSEIAAERREWEREILKFQTEKQAVLDDIKLLEYEYEKTKSENIIKAEKSRVDTDKELEARRAEALVKLEEEQAALISAHKKSMADAKSRHLEETAAYGKELLDFETKKAAKIAELDALGAKFEQKSAENATNLAALHAERLREADEKRLAYLAEIEQTRQERIAALETIYLEKSTLLENSRIEKLEAARKEIMAAERDVHALNQVKFNLDKQIENLRAETEKITAENEAIKTAAILEREMELENLATAKLEEAEKICRRRIETATERATKIEADGMAKEEKLAADIASGTETLLELRRLATAQKLQTEQERDENLEKIEAEKLAAYDKFSKEKLAKLTDIERELEAYKAERISGIQEDIARQSKANYRQIDELALLNDEYNQRMKHLQEVSLNIEAEKRNIEFKNAQIRQLQDMNNELSLRLAALENHNPSPIEPPIFDEE
jgi:hypothetical protein